MTGLGAGVSEHDEHFAGATAPEGNGPSCPWCGSHDKPHNAGHPGGKYLCGCGSLHNGSDSEWRALATHRRQVIERRSRKSEQ